MEYPQVVSLPTLVRFDTPNLILRGLPHSLYFSSKRGFANAISLSDREHSLVANGVPCDFDKLTGKMVKGTSKVVDDISGNQGDARVNLFDACGVIDVKALMPRLAIRLGADSVRFTLNKPVPDGFEIFEVCLSPFDFSSDECKSFIGSHNFYA